MGDQGSRDIWVVAYTRKQFDMLCGMASEWWDFELKNRMVRYVEDSEQLRGLKPCRVFVFGSYFKRADWQKIYEEILINKHIMLKIR